MKILNEEDLKNRIMEYSNKISNFLLFNDSMDFNDKLYLSYNKRLWGIVMAKYSDRIKYRELRLLYKHLVKTYK